MGMFRSLLVLGFGAAVGGAVLLAYRVSQETGKSLPEAFSDVPAEAQRLFADVRVRAEEAVERARMAYEEKQGEMEEHLQDSGSQAE